MPTQSTQESRAVRPAPATTPFTVDGRKVYVVDRGSGIPTLFVHGNPDSSDLWSGVISRIEGETRCVAPDLAGFGRSEANPDADLTLDGRAQWIDRLLEALEIKGSINLVVHDLGAHFGLAWAALHGNRLRRLVISNTFFSPDYRWHAWARVWRTPVLGELSLAGMNWLLFKRELRRGSRNLATEQIRDAYALFSPAMKKTILRVYRAADPKIFAGWDERLRAVTAKVPTLVIWGEHDPYIQQRFAASFGTNNISYVPDSGHWVAAEAPALFAKKLLEHFAEPA